MLSRMARLGEMLPLNVATVASTALESPRDHAIRLAVANSNMMLSSVSLEMVPAVRIHFSPPTSRFADLAAPEKTTFCWFARKTNSRSKHEQ
jgi:hypothetical protein